MQREAQVVEAALQEAHPTRCTEQMFVSSRTLDPAARHRAVATPRYRCTACGNLTRFDVTSTVRTRAFHHYSVGGELELEDVEVLSETIEEVSCRWCSSAASVVQVSAGATRPPG